MRPKRARFRKPARLANARWVAYGIAGAATALGATSAEAEIHYSGRIHVLVSFDEKTFPLSNGAVLWFEHSQTTTCYTRALFQVRSAAVSTGWQSDPTDRGVAKNLAIYRNLPISTQHFGHGYAVLATSPFCTNVGWEFCSPGSGIVGFKFNTGRGTQYGWARLRMKGSRYCTPSSGVQPPFNEWVQPPFNEFYVVDYAWADPGEDIRAGQTRSFSQEQGAVSPSGSLGLLALGKAGLELWRAQRLSSVTGK
jgi:hypothetical protein